MTGHRTARQPLPIPAPHLTDRGPDETDVEVAQRDTPFARLGHDHLAVAGAMTIVTAVVAALLATGLSGLSGNDPYRYHLDALDPTGAPAGWGGGIGAAHWFGVEPLTGRDLFSIVVFGSRTSLLVGVGATAVAMLIGVAVGGAPRGTSAGGLTPWQVELPTCCSDSRA